MNTIVVLGMHRSGTSLVANVLRALGVHMGTEFLEPDEGNEEGYWEDTLWLGINKHILANAGGDWKNPPPLKDVLVLRDKVAKLIKQAVGKRVGEGYRLWGFKDPRTCLTINLLHDFLPYPRYIVVRRPTRDIVRSLSKLHGNEQDWLNLARIYENRISYFLNSTKMEKCDVANVQFDDLVTQRYSFDSVVWLSHWLGIEGEEEKATSIIKIRR